MMQGGMEAKTSEEGERDGSQSPLKSKQKKAYVETTAAAPPAAKVKNVSTSFDSHIHKHQRVMVKASIKLTGANPTQGFIVNSLSAKSNLAGEKLVATYSIST